MGDNRKKVFVIMPFQEAFFEVYEMLKTEFAADYDFTNAGEEGNQQNILRDIIEPIYRADIIIADLTGLNANVMYELGIAHTLNKKTIVITQDDLSKLPFDLKQYRAKDYSTHFKKFAELVAYLKLNMSGAITGGVMYSNPVKDFMSISGIKENVFFAENPIFLEDDSERGFLDFLADIEDDTQSFLEDILNLTEDINTMGKGVRKSSDEITRVNKTGGNGTASFARKETKKAASHISDFSTKLHEHNMSFETLWSSIEQSTLGLLENRFVSLPANQPPLKKYLRSLCELGDAIDKSNSQVEDLKERMEELQGIERSMSHATRSCAETLSSYIGITERIASSIGKIIKKSRPIVGEISVEESDD